MINGTSALSAASARFTEALRSADGPTDEYASRPAAPMPSSSGGGGGGSITYMPMPQLMGAPAYGRPPRIVEAAPRPFDPDDLPLEAERTPEDVAYLSDVVGIGPTVEEPTITPSSQGGLRGVASRLFRASD